MKKILSFFVFFALMTGCFAISKIVSVQNPLEVYVAEYDITSDSAYISWRDMRNFFETVDYEITLNGVRLEKTANEGAFDSNVTNAEYKKAFYEHYTKKVTGIEMSRNHDCFYRLTGLSPDTEYKLQIKTISRQKKNNGKESAEIVFRTKPLSGIIDVTEYGAVYGEKIIDIQNKNGEKELIEKNTKAIQKAIDDCPSGGVVYIPNGIFVCGGLNLKSDMTLKIDGVLCSSPFPEHYDFGFLMYEYYTDKRYWGLLNARGARNLTITGTGTIDGNGWFFADDHGRPSESWQIYSEEGDVDFSKNSSKARRLVKYCKGNKDNVYNTGILARYSCEAFLKKLGKNDYTATEQELSYAYACRPTTVILRNCKNLLVSDLLLINPANHMLNIIDSEDVTVTGLTELTYNANNGDGIGIICSRNVKIFNNFIDTGDDSIVFGAGVGKAALTTGQKGVENVKVFGNYIHHGHGGVAFGSHTALMINDVHVNNNVFNHTDTPYRFKSASVNGGKVWNIDFSNNAIANVKQAVVMTTSYSDAGTVSKYGAADKPATFENIRFSTNTVYNVAGRTISIEGLPEAKHTSIFFSGNSFSTLAPSGIFARNAGWISISENIFKKNKKFALEFTDCNNINLSRNKGIKNLKDIAEDKK